MKSDARNTRGLERERAVDLSLYLFSRNRPLSQIVRVLFSPRLFYLRDVLSSKNLANTRQSKSCTLH